MPIVWGSSSARAAVQHCGMGARGSPSEHFSLLTALVILSFPELHLHVARHVARSRSQHILSTIFFDHTSGAVGVCCSTSHPQPNMCRYHDAIHHAERKCVFNADGLCRVAARPVDQSRADIVELVQARPRAGLTVRSSSPCATASKWSRIFRIRLRFPSTALRGRHYGLTPFLWAA